MSSLFNEAEADQEVITSLLRELKRRNIMSKLFKDQDGNLFLAHQFEAVSAERAQEMLSELQGDVSMLQAVLAQPEATGTDPQSDAASNESPDAAQNPSANPTDQDPTPAETPQEAPAAPAEATATPEGESVQTAPADPQVTPEQAPLQ